MVNARNYALASLFKETPDREHNWEFGCWDITVPVADNSVTLSDDPQDYAAEFNVSSPSVPSLLTCGVCDHPVISHIPANAFRTHPITDRPLCHRRIETWVPLNPNFSDEQDYYLHDSSYNHLSLAEDYTGPGIMERSSEPDYFDPNIELDALDRWTDTHPDEQTQALDYWYAESATSSFLHGTYAPNTTQAQGNLPKADSKQVRNAYVEGFDGFLAKELFNIGITEKYTSHLLNLYYDRKTGHLRCGSVEITFDAVTVTATCVNSKCHTKSPTGNYERNALSINIEGATREAMEEFVYSIISHGNNHSHSWFHNRATHPETFTDVTTIVPKDQYGVAVLDDEGKPAFIHSAETYTVTATKEPLYYELPVVMGPATEDLSTGEVVMGHLRFCEEPRCSCSSLASKAV